MRFIIMLQSIVSGFFFLLIGLFCGPALIIAGFQLLRGQKVRLPSVIKPLGRTVLALAALLVATAEVVANLVAEKWPTKYACLRPIVRPAVKFGIFAATVWMVVNFLLVLADR